MSTADYYMERSAAHTTETPDPSHSDYPYYGRSRRGSVSSSRFSARLSRRSSVRDDIQTLDEFLRKQRVIRYMQEERERSERTKILREEHDAWVEFRAHERSDRLKYMTEQEIADLLQREADEAMREKNAAENATQRAAEDATRRRQSIADIRKKEEDAAIARRRNEADAEEARRKAAREATQRQQALAEVEQARQVSLELRQREEDLLAKCKRLENELAEADAAKAAAQKAQKNAEDNLNAERKRNSTERLGAASSAQQAADLLKKNDDLRKQINALNRKLEAMEKQNEHLDSSCREKDELINDLYRQKDASDAERSALQDQLDNVTPAPPPKAQPQDNSHKELEKERAARVAEQKKCAQLEKALADIQAQARAEEEQKAAAARAQSEMERKARAAAEDARKAREDLSAEVRRREKAEQDATRLGEDLKNEREIRGAAMVAQRARPAANAANADRKKIADLEKTVEALRNDKKIEADKVMCLKNELQSAQEELQHESEARGKFEALAAAHVGGKDDRVPKAELTRAQNELRDCQKKLKQSEANTKAAHDKAEKEIKALKDWCARLSEEHERQMREAEYSPRFVQNGTQQAQGKKNDTKTPDVAELQREIEKLKAEIAELKQQLQASMEREKASEEKARQSASDLEKALAEKEALQKESDRLAKECEELGKKNEQQTGSAAPEQAGDSHPVQESPVERKNSVETPARAEGSNAPGAGGSTSQKNQPEPHDKPEGAKSNPKGTQASATGNNAVKASEEKKKKTTCGC